MVAAIVPTLAHISIFNPHIAGGRCGTVDEQGVLCEHRSLRFNAPLQYIALVFYQILYSHRRGYHVRPRAIVVELATRQGQYGHRQVGQSGVGARRILTQCATKVAIQVVVARQRCKMSARCAALATIGSGLTLLHQALDSLVAEQPHPDVHQHQVRGHQFGLLCSCRLLQHKVELCGRLAVHQKHAMVRCLHGVGPQTIAHHVGLGNVLQSFGGAQQYIATHYQCVQRCRCLVHDVVVERQLQVEQRLVNALAACPPEHGYWGEHLAAWCVGRQSPALSASMQQHTFVLCQPCVKTHICTFVGMGRLEQPCRAAARTKFVVGRVGCAVVCITLRPRQLVKHPDGIRWQR